MKVPKVRLSRKLVLIVGGVLVLCGGTGAAAVYIGTDALLGPSYGELNGLSCIEVQTVEIHKKNRFWIRKYITTEEPGDGVARVKTALRIAKTVQAEKKADLVQVVVLDANGPTARGKMRGRAVGADVIFMPDPKRVPEASSARILTARYADGMAAANGDFFGQRVDMTESDIQALVARLDDSTDCVTPEIVLPDGAEGGHGAPAAGHGEKPAAEHGEKSTEGHGEAPAEGHGEAPADAHGEAPTGEHGAETPVAEHGAEESKGWMASLMGMVGLGGDEAPAEAHGAADAGHGETPVEGHGAADAGHGEPAPAGHDSGQGEGHEAPAEDNAALADGAHAPEAAVHDDAAAAHASAPDATQADGHDAPAHDAAGHDKPAKKAPAHAAAATGEDGTGHGSADGHDAPVTEDQVKEAVTHEAETPAVETSDAPADGHEATAPEVPSHDAAVAEAPADGGGWFSSLKSMVGLGGEDAAASGEGEAAPAETPAAPAASGEDHGAAWLEKMRAQPIEPASDGSAPAASNEQDPAGDHPAAAGSADAGHAVEVQAAPNEDEAVLPPKKIIPEQEAKAEH